LESTCQSGFLILARSSSRTSLSSFESSMEKFPQQPEQHTLECTRAKIQAWRQANAKGLSAFYGAGKSTSWADQLPPIDDYTQTTASSIDEDSASFTTESTDSKLDECSRNAAPQGPICISLASEIVREDPRDFHQETFHKNALSSSPCTGCGSPLSAGFQFCTECGQEVSMPCGNCGAMVRAGFRFCTECGHKADGCAKTVSQQMCCSTPNEAYNAWAAQRTPLSASAPRFIPNLHDDFWATAPETNPLLHGLLHVVAPEMVQEIEKSHTICESVLLQAMPDHYDD